MALQHKLHKALHSVMRLTLAGIIVTQVALTFTERRLDSIFIIDYSIITSLLA